MIEKGKWICDNCRKEISKENNMAYSDNGVHIEGEFCLCEFCYMNLQKAW